MDIFTISQKSQNDPTAERFRKLADAQQKVIDDKRRPMTQNPTPKRRKEEMSRRIDANQLERVQGAMRAIADARYLGSLPGVLDNVRSKTQVEPLVRKRIDSCGYYDLFETSEYSDKSDAGVALQALLHAASDPIAAAAKVKADNLRRLEQSVDFKPIPGFFPTPKPLVSLMIEAADVQPGDLVLEPSAGRGDIADEVAKITGVSNVHTWEVNYDLRAILEAKGYRVAGDFLTEPSGTQFDKVLMNPPFERGQDIEHVRAAYYRIKQGGRLVAIMSEGSFSRSGCRETEFQYWLAAIGGVSEKNPDGGFTGKDASRQTGVATRMVVIHK